MAKLQLTKPEYTRGENWKEIQPLIVLCPVSVSLEAKTMLPRVHCREVQNYLQVTGEQKV